jgi:hypothetical protein
MCVLLGMGRRGTSVLVGVCMIALGMVADGGFARGGNLPPALLAGYGNGVHAYHEGDYQCSYDELTEVIEAGSNDPRAYFFRGLAALKLGRSDEAEADFQQGANLEADGTGGRIVSRALERVQGCDRLKLEHYRAQARVAAVQRDREAVRQRYSDIQDAEADVLRRRRPESIAPIEPSKGPAPKSLPGSTGPAPQPPEETPAEEPEEEPAGEPAEEDGEPAEAADPFGDEPAAEESADDQRDEQVEREAAEVDDAADQRDQQAEVEAGGEAR